jgi:outer membrane receptor protein involved in Fe transport
MFPMEFWIDDRSKFRASDIFLKGSWKDLVAEVYRHDDRLDGFAEPFPTAAQPSRQFASAHELKQTVDIIALKYNHAPQDARVTFAADASWSHRSGMLCAGCHAAQEQPQFSNPQNHGYQAIGDFRTGLHMIPGHDILLGIEARRLDRAQHKIELSPEGQVVSGYNKVAVYAQDQFTMWRDRLRAVIGLRYDGKTKLFDAKTSPRASLNYAPNDRLVLRGGYSTAFRFPNFFELYQDTWFSNFSSSDQSFPAFGTTAFVPNPTLRPEEIRNLEVGAEYQISPTVSAKADLYRSSLKDFIVIAFVGRPAPALGGLQFQNNPSNAVIQGGELELRSNIGRATGFINYAYQKNEQTNGSPGLEFVYAPKEKINLGVYAGPFSGFRGAIEASSKGSVAAPRLWRGVLGPGAPAIPTLDSYTLLNARISYDLPLHTRGTQQPLRLSLFGNNMLNKQVRETLIGVDTHLVGREFFAQLEVHF